MSSVRERVRRELSLRPDENTVGTLVGGLIGSMLVWALRTVAVLAVADIWGVV